MLYALGLLVVPLAIALVAWRAMVWMPGRKFRGPLPELTGEQLEIRDALRNDLRMLAQEIGERNVSQHYSRLVAAGEFLEQALHQAGYDTRREEFEVEGRTVWNVVADKAGAVDSPEILVIGSHYDTVPGSPGANDNGSAVVANLALARFFSKLELPISLRFAFFVNEEFPYYMTPAMGALRNAELSKRQNEPILGMICLETIGWYSNEPGSQRYPARPLGWLYPTTGNFVAAVANIASGSFVRKVVRGFRRVAFPIEGMAAPSVLKDIFRSDHAAFWAQGYPAVMITDTANFRYRYYHTPDDTIDKIDYDSLARVVVGLSESVLEVARGG